MALAECIASAACGVGIQDDKKAEWSEDAFPHEAQLESSSKIFNDIDEADLLDVLRFVIESSKQHFNPNYRLRGLWIDCDISYMYYFKIYTATSKAMAIILVNFLAFAVCEKVLEAAASVVNTFDMPLEILLHFVSTVPREFTDYGGKQIAVAWIPSLWFAPQNTFPLLSFFFFFY